MARVIKITYLYMLTNKFYDDTGRISYAVVMTIKPTQKPIEFRKQFLEFLNKYGN